MIWCLLYYTVQDLKWEIKFFKRERGEEGDREKQTRCHAGNKWGPKGELRPVSVGRIAHWDEGHLAGHQAPNQFLTWGVDQGGQGMVETTCTQARHESKSGINRRQQTELLYWILTTTLHPTPKRSPHFLEILLGLTAMVWVMSSLFFSWFLAKAS